MDRFREPNTFIGVAEAGGFSAAARRTGESRSAIGKVIGVLEKRSTCAVQRYLNIDRGHPAMRTR